MDEMSFFLDDLDEFEDMQSPVNLATAAIIGACMEVHAALGPGHARAVYLRALAYEFAMRKIPFIQNQPVPLTYKGKTVGEKKLDFVVAGLVVLNVKKVNRIRPVHPTAMKSHLKAANMRLGLIVNFNTKALMDGVVRVTMQEPTRFA